MQKQINNSYQCNPKDFTVICKWSGTWWKPWTWRQYSTMYSLKAFELINIALVEEPINPPCKIINYDNTPPEGYSGDPQKDAPQYKGVWKC